MRRSATGCSNKGVTTRNAASLFTGAGQGATLAFSASIPPPAKSLRHRRTRVFAHAERLGDPRTAFEDDAVIEGRQFDHPFVVVFENAVAVADPKRREPASVASAARCSLVAVSGDFPAMSCTCDSAPAQNQNPMRWSIERILLSSAAVYCLAI